MSMTLELPSYVQGICGSSALLDISMTTAKNLPYAFFAKELHIHNLTNFLSSRISYGESTLRSLASAVYNLVVSTIFTAFVIVTLGTFSEINTTCKKLWIYASLAVACATIGAIGIVSTRAAAVANATLLGVSGQYITKAAERDIVTFVKQFFSEYKERIADSLPSTIDIRLIDEKLRGASKYSDLIAIAQDVFSTIRNAQ